MHRNAQYNILGLIIPILALSGCGSETSDDVATANIRATLDVESYGDGTATVHAALARAGGGLFSTSYIELICPDMLVTSSTTQTGSKVMRQGQDALGKIYYYTSIAGNSGDTFTVSLLRDEDHVTAESSNVIMPDDFSVTAPTSSDTYARNTNSLTINWSPTGSGDDVDLYVYGDCISSLSTSLSGDTGSYTIDPGDLVYSYYPEPDDLNYNNGQLYTDISSCGITVRVTKSRTGVVDTAFAGGSFTAYNHRKVTLMSTYN